MKFSEIVFLNRPHIETLKEEMSETDFIALIQRSYWRINQKRKRERNLDSTQSYFENDDHTQG